MTLPTLDEVRAWIQVPASVLPDDQLRVVVDAEATLIEASCRVAVLPADALDLAVAVTGPTAWSDYSGILPESAVRFVGDEAAVRAATVYEVQGIHASQAGGLYASGVRVVPSQVADAIVAGTPYAVSPLLPRDVTLHGLADGGYAPPLVQSLYRRVAREVAARGVPLGMIGADAEYGPARLSRWDAEVDRLEGPYRVLVFG